MVLGPAMLTVQKKEHYTHVVNFYPEYLYF